jgi:recombination protein RecA
MSVALADRAQLIDALRRQMGAHRPAPPDALAPIGIEALDRMMGGLPKGRLSEIVGRRSSGRTALALSVLAAATRRGEAAALVDVDGMLDARGAEAAGIELQRLLWVRAGDGKRGLRAADLIARAGGFGVVVLDLGERPPRAPDASWIRLARAAAESHLALVVVSPRPAARTFAAITLETSRGRPEVTALDRAAGPSPRVVRAVESCVQVVRSKLGAPGASAQVRWPLR